VHLDGGRGDGLGERGGDPGGGHGGRDGRGGHGGRGGDRRSAGGARCGPRAHGDRRDGEGGVNRGHAPEQVLRKRLSAGRDHFDGEASPRDDDRGRPGRRGDRGRRGGRRGQGRPRRDRGRHAVDGRGGDRHQRGRRGVALDLKQGLDDDGAGYG